MALKVMTGGGGGGGRLSIRLKGPQISDQK